MSRRNRHHAFTLIELLLVVMIIALLMALMFPALSKARQAGFRAQCLLNLYQVGLASSIYQDDHEDTMPIGKPTRGISNYNHGGRYPVRVSKIGRSYTRRPSDRPLNAYVHPNLPLGKLASYSDLEDYKQFNFPAFDCPADSSYNYQEGWQNTTIRHGLSSYLAVGTSYFFNLAWYGGSDWKYSAEAEPLTWGEGIRHFKRARLVYPSRFVAFYDDPADYHVARRASPPLSHHGVDGQHAMAFLDTHANFVTYDETDRPVNGAYAILFPEQMKR